MHLSFDFAFVLLQPDAQVDGANEHLHNLNRKMKNALKEVRSADRFIIDFILIVVILGIATYCYNMFTGRA